MGTQICITVWFEYSFVIKPNGRVLPEYPALRDKAGESLVSLVPYFEVGEPC
jgi:hypothetical protein